MYQNSIFKYLSNVILANCFCSLSGPPPVTQEEDKDCDDACPAEEVSTAEGEVEEKLEGATAIVATDAESNSEQGEVKVFAKSEAFAEEEPKQEQITTPKSPEGKIANKEVKL